MRSRKLASVVRPAAQGDWTGCLDHSKEAEGTELFQLKKSSLWLPGQGRSSGLDLDVRVCSRLGGADEERGVDAP